MKGLVENEKKGRLITGIFPTGFWSDFICQKNGC